ncbi:MAG: hypothetical protein ACXWZM_04465 [Solirubrobacterales bacterium]
MADRKRSQRRKRKQRSAARNGGAGEVAPSAMERGYAKAEKRNREAREALRPLERGERPAAVTVGACFAALIAAIFWVSSLVALLSDATVNGQEPNPASLALFAVIMSAMAWGMWKARYWAVLGFQMLLVLFLLAAVAGIVNANTWLQLAGTTLLIVGAGTLFFFMVKALARIQMPQRPDQR